VEELWSIHQWLDALEEGSLVSKKAIANYARWMLEKQIF
jgi:hypothetical protein